MPPRSSGRGRSNTSEIFAILIVAALVIVCILRTYSAWIFAESKVDESELVLFAVGFLGGSLDPGWNGYGHLGMYILGAVYAVVGYAQVLLGQYQSIVDFSAAQLEPGTFYSLGRFVMSFLLMAATLLIAKLIYRETKQLALAGTYVILLGFFPFIVKYSNYIRADTFVTFFSVLALYWAVLARNNADVLRVAAASGAAIACKISALGLAMLPAVVAFDLWRQQRLERHHFFLACALPIIFAKVFAPHMDYVALLKGVVGMEILGGQSFVRTHFGSVIEKIAAVVNFHLQALGPPILMMAAASSLLLWTSINRLVAYFWIVLALLTVPYLAGSTLRDYWFLPSYMLLSGMSLLTVSYAGNLLVRYKTMLARAFVYGICALVLAFPVRASLTAYTDLVRAKTDNRLTNKQAAKKWLIENHLGKTPILIDRHFSWLYPRVYDPQQLKHARDTSGFFTYSRDSSPFLARVFEHYLLSVYPGEFQAVAQIARVLRFEVQLEKRIKTLKLPLICSTYSTHCELTTLESAVRVKVDIEGEHLKLSEIRDGATLNFRSAGAVPIDGSYKLITALPLRDQLLTPDLATPLLMARTDVDGDYVAEKLIHDRDLKIWVQKLGVDERDSILIAGDQAMFVTSPAGYQRFESMQSRPGNKEDEAEIGRFRRHYQDLTACERVARFTENQGVAIEVYRVLAAGPGLQSCRF